MRNYRTIVGGAATLTLVILAGTPRAAEAQISDTAPPQLVTVSFTPTAVNVIGSAQSVTVTATVTDDLSGTSGVSVRFVSPSGRIFQPINGLGLGRISGTALNGVYRGTMSMPQFTEAGVWKLDFVSVSDSVGNSTTLRTANLQALGQPTDLTVTSIQDIEPPRISHIAFAPSGIDVSTGPQSLTVALTLTDNVSGVDLTSNAFVEFRVGFISPNGIQQQVLSRQYFSLASGDALNGVWQASRTFPRFSEPGEWRINYLRLLDFAGNQSFLSTQALEALGLQTRFVVQSTPSDTAPPQLTSLAFSPSVIDTSTGSRTVAVTMTIADDLAGTDFSSDTPFVTFFHGLFFRSPSGAQIRSVCCGSFTRVAGTPLNGTWQASIFFPQFSEAGTWTPTVSGIEDGVSNQVSLTTAQLVSAGFPTQLVVFQPSQTTDGSVGSGGGVVSDTVFGTRASITFPPGALPATTSVAIDVLSTPLSVPTPQGFTAGTLFVNIQLTPTPPMPFTAPGLTVVLPFTTFKTPSSFVYLYRLDTGTGLLVPAVGVNGVNVVGVVNADGLSATFNGVSRLSTVVGFFATAVPGDLNGDGSVDCADMAIVKAAFGRRTGQLGFDPRADVNRNGIVDVNDLAAVSRQLAPGTTCG